MNQENVPTNVTSTVSKYFHKKLIYKMDSYILHTISLVIILLFVIAIISNHYTKHKSKHMAVLTI